MADAGPHDSKILLIDDEADVLEMLGRMLERDGYHAVVKTADPFAAVRLFGEFKPDLVVLDLIMPGLSGSEVLAQLRAVIPAETHLPILVVTGDLDLETRSQVLREGATDFMTKPYDADEIRARIANLLKTRSLHLLLEAKREELRASVRDLTGTNAALRAEAAARERAEVALKQGEGTLREATETAERANAAKSEFLSRASHELRTPLSHILGFAQLLETEVLTPEQQDNVQQILASGRHLLELIDRILAISKSELNDLAVRKTGRSSPGDHPDFFKSPSPPTPKE